MTKQDLLNDLNSKFSSIVKTVEQENLTSEDGKNIKTYLANVMEKNTEGNAGVKRNIAFYVVNEGEADEEALYQNSEAKVQTQTKDFADKLENVAKDKVQDDTIECYKIIEVNEEGKFGVIEAYVKNGEVVNKKNFLIYKEKGNGNQFIEIA